MTVQDRARRDGDYAGRVPLAVKRMLQTAKRFVPVGDIVRGVQPKQLELARRSADDLRALQYMLSTLFTRWLKWTWRLRMGALRSFGTPTFELRTTKLFLSTAR